MGNEEGRRFIKCLCDCGNFHTTLTKSILRELTKSCGCLKKELLKNKSPEFPWKSIMQSYIKHNANDRNLTFNLTEKEFTNLCLNNCHYCGLGPKIKTDIVGILRNGIDRLNNDIGYELSNCVSCCTMCNMAKRIYPYDTFIEWINRLKQHTIPPLPSSPPVIT